MNKPDFRIWCKAWKPPRFATLSEFNVYGQKTYEDVFNELFGTHLYVLQEYTGRLDLKNNKIYEGDILSWMDDETKRLKLWNEGDGEGDLAVVEGNDEQSGWMGTIQSKFGGEGYEMLNSSRYTKEWIIVGNIFQNPNLLESS